MDQDRHEEGEASRSSELIDSFGPDGQQEGQNRDAETLERVRNLDGIQVTPVSKEHSVLLEPRVLPDPNLAGHRPKHTLKVKQDGDDSQSRLEFNSQPGVSSKRTGSSRAKAKDLQAGSNRGARSSKGADSAPVRSPRSPPGEERRPREDDRGQGDRGSSVHPRSWYPEWRFGNRTFPMPRLSDDPREIFWDYYGMDPRLQWMPPQDLGRRHYDRYYPGSPPRNERSRERSYYSQRVRDLPRHAPNHRNDERPFRSSTPRRENRRTGYDQPGSSRAPRSAPPPRSHAQRSPEAQPPPTVVSPVRERSRSRSRSRSVQANRSPLPEFPASPDPDRYLSRSEQELGGSEYSHPNNAQEDFAQNNGRAEEPNQERETEAEPQQGNGPPGRPNQEEFVRIDDLQNYLDAAMARELARRFPPAPVEPTLPFGDRVAGESMAQQDVLERIKPCYSQIKRVKNLSSGKTTFAYDYDLSLPDGFWATPEPSLTNPSTNVLDRIGTFNKLVAPTISKWWSRSSQPQSEEVEEEDNQAQEDKPPKRWDALVNPAVPGKCKVGELESFFSGKPLAEWRNQSVLGEGRFLVLDEELFQNNSLVKWDKSTHTLLPSIEYKARLAARDSFSALDMLKAQQTKTRPLLVNWNKPGVWDEQTGLAKTENGELVAPESGLTLAQSVTKEDLLNELHNRSDLTSLAIAQLEHQSKVIEALQTEVKLQMKDAFLFHAMPPSSNMTLVDALHSSRLSVPSLFGPVPVYYRDKVRNHPKEFPSLKPPAFMNVSGPVFKPKFRGGPSGFRGSYASTSQANLQRAPRGQARRSRGTKNPKRGGRAYSSQVLQPATRGAGSRSRGRGRGKGKSRGGKTSRGARGKKPR